MGIRGLEKFFEYHLGVGCRRVTMSQLISEVNTRNFKTGDDKPLESNTIVVDTQSCFRMMFGCLDWLVEGYGTREWMDRLIWFVQSFRDLNIPLVFFFGSSNLVENRERLEARRKLIAHVHRAIDSPANRIRFPEGFDDSVMPNWQVTMASILRYSLKCETYIVAIEDYRQEIMSYVQEHKCLAILTQNTDFVACQVDALVLSSKHFVMEDMSTLIYDRLQLASSLGIRVEDFPLLAIMAGDGSVPLCEKIRGFQRRICNKFQFNQVSSKILMPAIARYIKKLSQNEHIETTLARLAVDLFDDSSRVELLQRCYYSYFSKNTSSISGEKKLDPKEGDVLTPESNWLEILRGARRLYRKALIPYMMYSVLHEQIFEGDMAFEDLRYSRGTNALARDQSSFTVLRPLRSRLYGILLSEIYREDSSEPVTVQEWCSEDENSFTKPVIVTPIKPEVYQPRLIGIWKVDHDVTNDDVTWKLFLSTVSPSLDVAKWRSFDEKLLFPTLTAYHLYETKYVNETELNAILVTFASFSLYDNIEKLSRLCYSLLDFRAVNISIALGRTFSLISNTVHACGCPAHWTVEDIRMRFEGKVFQIKYADMVKNKKTDIKALCENNDDCFKLFERMKNIIVDETKKADELSKDLGRKVAEMVI